MAGLQGGIIMSIANEHEIGLLDPEWVKLIEDAFRLGLSTEEIREFFTKIVSG